MRVGLFPGQGVPVNAVLHAIPAHDSFVKAASETLGYDLRRKVEQFAQRSRSILPTSVAQPAIFTASLSSFYRQEQSCDVFLGHSLGEYAALVATEAMTFEHALCVVQVRGAAMQAVADKASGGMAAVLGLSLDEVESIDSATGVRVANDNAPGQVVLAGDDASLVRAATLVRARNGRAVRLDVAGAFHTPQVGPAVDPLRHSLDHIVIRAPQIPVVSNVTGAHYRAPGEIRKLLLEQMTTRVRFRDALESVWRDGVSEYIDFGPGRVVGGLAERTFKAMATTPSELVG